MKGRGDDNAAGESGERMHVPVVRYVYVNVLFRREEMEGCNLQIAHRINRPTIAPIGSNVIVYHSLSADRACEQVAYIEAAAGSLLQRADLVRQRGAGGWLQTTPAHGSATWANRRPIRETCSRST